MKHCHLDSQSLTLLLRVLSVINVEIHVIFCELSDPPPK